MRHHQGMHKPQPLGRMHVSAVAHNATTRKAGAGAGVRLLHLLWNWRPASPVKARPRSTVQLPHLEQVRGLVQRDAARRLVVHLRHAGWQWGQGFDGGQDPPWAYFSALGASRTRLLPLGVPPRLPPSSGGVPHVPSSYSFWLGAVPLPRSLPLASMCLLGNTQTIDHGVHREAGCSPGVPHGTCT